MPEEKLKPDEILGQIDYIPGKKSWMDAHAEFKKGTYSYVAPAKHHEYLGLPNPREWSPKDDDWKLPPDWKEIILILSEG